MRRLADHFHLGLLIVASFAMDLAYRGGNQAYQEAGLAAHGTPVQLSWLGACAAFCYSTMCLLSGGISDRIGRKTAAALSCVGLAAAYVLAGWVQDIHQLLLLAALAGGSLAFFWPAVQAWIADLSGRGRRRLARRLAIFNVSWAAGLAAGPTYTGFLWAYGAGSGLSQRLVFGSIAGSVLLIAVVLLLTRSCAIDPDAVSEADDWGAQAHPQAASLLFAARAGTFASWFAVGVIGSLFPKLAAELGFDERLRGVLASCFHVGQVGMFCVALAPGSWYYRRWPVLVAEGLALLGMLTLVWARSPWHFAAAFLIAGVCSGVAYTASLFHSLHGRTEDRGKLAGIHEAILASGVFLSPLIGGFLAQYVSLRAPFVMVGIAFAGAMAAQLVSRSVAGRQGTLH